MNLLLSINGGQLSTEVEAGDTLLDALRGNGYTSVKDGCANGDCGTCAVLIDGRAVASCLVFAGQAEGHEITTIEGVTGADQAYHPLQQTMLDAGGVQCGYCIPAMILTAADLLERNPSPTRDHISSYLAGNLCRCTGYVKQIDAIEMAAAILRGDDDE
ncbi:MAG: (2Fe-2S)-binding protein [Actinomycetota bacterium]|nr:(2Fe-2S)-binding protein [Actinomycetota bacterium]